MKANSRQLSLSLTSLALAIATSSSQSVSAATLYSVFDLGGVTETDTVEVSDVNDLGQVIGESSNIDDAAVTFRTAPNRPINPATDVIDIDTDAITISSDINNLGQVVGTAFNPYSGGIRTDANGLLTDNLFPVVDANAINDLGQIAGRGLVDSCGFGCGEPERFNAVRVENSNNGTAQIIDLGTLGGTSSSGNGINEHGQVVGTSAISDGQGRAFRTAPNSVINPATDNLGTLGSGTPGDFSEATDINNLSQVVGFSTNANGETHAFRTAANSAINPETDDLGTLGGSFSLAEAINESGQVVGSSLIVNGELRAFLFDNDTMFDLNDLVAGDINVTFTEAVGINESGQIAVNGFFGNDTRSSRIFLLTPVPEPTSMLGVLAFGAGAGFLRTRAAKQKVKA